MTIALGRWEALITIPSSTSITVTNSGGGPTVVSLTPGDYFLTSAGGYSSLLAHIQARLIAVRPPASGTWVVSMSTGTSGTGQVTINCTSGTWSIDWTTSTYGPQLRDLLGFAANLTGVSGAQTGPAQAKGLWFPNCTLNLDGHPLMAPKVTDRRASESPTGFTTTLVGTMKIKHRNLRYTLVPEDRFREASAVLANASWEKFLDDTQLRQGSNLFKPGAPVQIYMGYGGTEQLVGKDGQSGLGAPGWSLNMNELSTVMARRDNDTTALWRIDVAEITAYIPD